MSEKLYADRPPWDLEPWYSRHASAMTTESLHSKAAIAAELAYRDQEIDRLRRNADNAHQAHAQVLSQLSALRGAVLDWLKESPMAERISQRRCYELRGLCGGAEEALDTSQETSPDLSTMKGRLEEAKRSLAARPAWMRRDAEDSE